MQKAHTYLIGVIFSLIVFSVIALAFKSAPFHSSKEHSDDIRNHIDSKIDQIKGIYRRLDAKSNDEIAEEVSKLESESIQLFVYGADGDLRVWSHPTLPLINKKEWWVEQSNNRVCFKTVVSGSNVIGCEKIHSSFKNDRITESNALHYLKHTNSIAEFSKFIFFYLAFFLTFLFLKEKLYTSTKTSYFFYASSFLLLVLFLICSEQYFDDLDIFNSTNFSSFEILSPASYLVGSLFVLLIGISFSNRSIDIKQSNYLPFYFIIPCFMLALFLKSLAYLFAKDSNIQFENISFDQFSLWGYSLGAIILLYSIHLVFQTFSSLVIQQKKINRYSILGSILISYLAFHFLLNIAIPWYLLVLYLICYYYSLELNSESLSSKLIWTIWFLILNAGLVSSVLYFYTIKKDIRQTQEYLQAIYTNKDEQDTKVLIDLQQSIKSSSTFKNIFANSGNNKFHKDDLLIYLNSSFTPSSSLQVEDVFLLDAEGESRIVNEEKTENTIASPYLIKIADDGSILYNPISNKLLFTFQEKREKLFIALFEPNIQKPKKNIPYGLFSDKVYLNGEITALPEINIDGLKNDTIVQRGANSHIFKTVENNKLLYVKKTYSNLLRPISLFSFIFCLSGIFVFIISVLSLKFDLFKSPYLNIANFGALSTKIQMVIIFLILLSFLSIAIVTSLYFNQILKNNQEKNISAKVITINNSLQNRLSAITDLQSALNLIENELPKLSEVNNVLGSFYNKQGQSTLSQIQTTAYPFYPYYQHKAHGKKESYTLQSYASVSAYFPITHPVLGNIGYISLHDNNYSKGSVRSSISDFLSSMLNLYVFLFFIAGALAIAISKSITRPLTALQLRLKSIKFGSKNEVIEWEANDEIGELITSYNDMLVKLEQNIELLAKTERDTAWREMAKQVAHEIKNPLTPMKLSIQYLKRAIDSDPNNTEAIVNKISTTLIEQIDNLAEIANAFSNFATLPQANNDKIVLNEVVEVVHDLFRKRDDMEIKLFEPLNSIEVFADKNHMIRVLNNLVKNAIQSIPEERKGLILISLYKENDKAVIKVQDNGKGIPKELQEKVFTPYFTTKTSGTGLGLAISTNMLSAFDGRMYFETEEGHGTSFYIEIPLMRETYKYHEGEKLILE